MRVSAIIVAAGAGRRAGGQIPKQFQMLAGKPLLTYTLDKFQRSRAIDDMVVVVPRDWQDHVWKKIVQSFGFSKAVELVVGGSERQDSVYAGLKTLKAMPDLVVVHDAVRPFVSVEKIEETIAASRETGGAILAVKPRDTVKSAQASFVEKTLERDTLWCVQTPQVFQIEILKAAYERAFKDGFYSTDDSALVERLGVKVKIVQGEYENIKITEPLDFELAERILEREQQQCG